MHSCFCEQDSLVWIYTLQSNLLQPNTLINLDLYWLALGKMDTSYTRFMQLLDGQGHIIVQQDSIPGLASYPTTVWDVGQRVGERVPLQLPGQLLAGNYTLQVGWYEYPSLERLVTSEGQDHVVLRTFQVK